MHTVLHCYFLLNIMHGAQWYILECVRGVPRGSRGWKSLSFGVPRWQLHRCSDLATLPSVGAIP